MIAVSLGGCGQPASTLPDRLLPSNQPWIALPFFSDRSLRAVTRYDGCFIRQSENGAVQGLHDLLHRSAGKVGAADRAGEESVACDQNLFGGKVEAYAALGVARRVQNIGGVGSGFDRVAGVHALINLYLPGWSYTNPGGLLVEYF